MTRPRMLIFGARGFLGGWLAAAARRNFEVAPPTRVELTDHLACNQLIETWRPDIVVLLAAISDIDRCERNPAIAEAVNVRAAENIARAARRARSRLIFASSGAVFDGTRAAYSEDDPPCPVNVYGQTKARAEEAVRAALADAIVVRFALVLGRALSSGTNALVNKLLAAWEVARSVPLLVSEHRNAIDAATSTSLLLELAANPAARGVFHIGSANALSRYEIGCALARAFGYSPDLVWPEQAPPPGRAPRGRYEFLRADKIARISRTPIPACEEAIERCAHATAETHS